MTGTFVSSLGIFGANIPIILKNRAFWLDKISVDLDYYWLLLPLSSRLCLRIIWLCRCLAKESAVLGCSWSSFLTV